MATKQIEIVDVITEGPMYPDYWQGQGTSYTNYTVCVTGCGWTEEEAYEDALEQLAQSDTKFDVKDVEKYITEEYNYKPDGETTVLDVLELSDEESEECESMFYVTIKIG